MTAPTNKYSYSNLAQVIGSTWPSFLPRPSDSSFLNHMWVQTLTLESNENRLEARTSFFFEQELSLAIPGLDAISLAIAAENGGTVVPLVMQLSPNLSFQLVNIPITLRLKTDLFKPARRVPANDTGQPDRFEVDTSKNYVEIVLAEVTLQVNGDGDITLDVGSSIDLPPCMIGDSGVVIEANNIELHLDANSPPSGKPQGWRGLYIHRASLYLPSELASIVGHQELNDAYIGNGGFSGSFRNTWPGTGLTAQLFGMQFSLQEVDLNFVQNALTRSEILGTITLPFFEQLLGVDIGITLDGSLTIALSSTQPASGPHASFGLWTFTKEGLLELTVESLGCQVEGGVFTAKLSGKIKPLVGGLDWPAFQVRELSIDSNGNVHLDGGWLNLREQYSLNLYGFKLEITKIGFGKNDDGSKWIGFSGGLKLVDGMQAGASIDGLRINWNENDQGDPLLDSIHLTLNGVGVDFEVPDVLRFHGAVSYHDQPQRRFEGDIRLQLISLDMEVDAKLVIGSTDGYTYLGIYLTAELPAGIPLFSTGLALYGLGGLFALQMEPDKHDDEQWYAIGGQQSYYHRTPVGVTDLTTKWINHQDSLALGAGVTIGTVADNGYAFSGRLLLVLVFPGPILMIEGRANLLKERARLNEEAIFRALAVLDGRAGTFLVGVDAQYKMNSSGRLIDIRAGAEAFFSLHDASAWHLYLGEKDPQEKRIRARLFSLFEASAYFMLDANQLSTGAKIGYSGNWHYGPLALTLEAWIEANVVVNWRPVHFHGDLALHAKFSVKIFGIGLGLGVDANIAADVFDPYHLLAHLKVEVSLPAPLPSFSPEFTLEWGPEPTLPPLPLPLKEIAVEHFKVTTSWPLPRSGDQPLLLPNYQSVQEGVRDEHDPSESLEPIHWIDVPVVPLDCRPHLTFSRPINDDAHIGVNPQPANPERELIGDPAKNQGPVRVRYSLREVALEKRTASGWVTIGEATPTSRSGALFGSWAPVPAMPDGGGERVAQVKLWLWSKTPFDYTRHTEGAWDDWFTSHFPDYPCIAPPSEQVQCYDFTHVDPNQPLYDQLKAFSNQKQSPWPFSLQSSTEPYITMLHPPLMGLTQTLCFPAAVSQDNKAVLDEITITLAAPALAVRITMVDASGVEGSGIDAKGKRINGFRGGKPDPRTIEIRVQGVQQVQLRSTSEMCLLKICIVTSPASQEVIAREEMARHLRDELAHWSQEDEVLEPHTTYRLRVVTAMEAHGEGALTGYARTFTQSEYAYFRTEGPPGLSRLSVPIGTASGDQVTLQDNAGHPIVVESSPSDSGGRHVLKSDLNSLIPYVRQTVPATVPASGEKPLLPRPVYRSYDVGIEFSENYVELMYRLEGRDLGLYLYDNNNQPILDARGRLLILTNQWGHSEQTSLAESVQRWLRLVNASTCATLDTTMLPATNALTTEGTARVLNADTLYEARLIPLLLHETFPGTHYPAATTINGPAGSFDRWYVRDEGSRSGPSRWAVTAENVSTSGFIVQTSGIQGGSSGSSDPAKPGTMLLLADIPALPGDHPDQPGNWTDYRMNVFVRATSGDQALGVIVRYHGPNTYYRFSMDRVLRYRRLVRVVEGVHTVLAEDDFVYRQNLDYLITIEAIGEALRIYQDGEPLFHITDTAIPQGRIGLYSWGNVGARFSDIRIDDFRKDASVVYRFSFTTSQFTNFFHHLHSFQDETWLQSTDADIASALAHAGLPTTDLADDETQAYETLANSILPQAAQQNLSSLQVTRVEHAHDALAFFLQSPEPIDWKRITLQLQRAKHFAPPPLVPHEVKLTNVHFGTMQPNEESVQLLLREATDLTGYRIEYAQFPDPVADGSGTPILFTDAFLGPLTTPTEAATILWQPSFIDLSEIEIVDAEGVVDGPSHWEVTSGVLTQSSTIHLPGTPPLLPGTYAVGGNFSWVDIEIVVRFYLIDNASIGLIFRYQDPKNYYAFSIDTEHNTMSLLKLVGGNVTVLWRDVNTSATQQSSVLTLRVVGSEIHGSLAGHALFTVYDGDLTYGRVGFACGSDPQARFDQVIVTNLTRQLGRWSLYDWGTEGGPSVWQMGGGVLTQRSSIAGGTAPTSPGTYAIAGDSTWTDYRLDMWARSDGTGPIGLLSRYQDQNNYYRFSIDASDGLQRLIKNARGNVTVLWERSAGPGITVGEPFTLTIEVLGSRLVGYINDTRLFDLSDATHSSGRIGLYCQGNAGARFEHVIVRRPSLEAYALLRDYFVEDDISGWSFRDEGMLEAPSQWAPADGVLRQTSPIHSFPDDGATLANLGTEAVAGDPAWTDTILSARLQSQAGAIGVMFRYQDENTYYRFSMDERWGYRRLIKKVRGTFVLLWEDQAGYKSGRPYDLTLIAVGNMLRGYMDGIPLFTVEDSDISSGQIGLYCWNNSDAQFAQVRVYPASLLSSNWLLQEWFPVFRPDFWAIRDEGDQERPSKWIVPDVGGELQQVSAIYGGSIDRSEPSKPGTYALAGDPTWTDYRVHVQLWSSDESGAIGVMFRYQDAQHYYQFSMNRALKYRRLVKNVAGTVSVLWEDNVLYTLDQRYMATLECTGNEITGYLNGVQLFTVVDDDLAAGQIGLYSWRNTSAHFASVQVAAYLWAPYFAFEKEERLPAGMRVQVYAGNSTMHQPPQETGTLQRFVSTLDETGQLHFLSRGTDLRLVTPGGTTGHERRFWPETTFEAPLAIRILRKADGTGCFLFQSDGAAFEAGIYRLRMTYRRDNLVADPNSQVLREAGESAPENVQIDIPWVLSTWQ